MGCHLLLEFTLSVVVISSHFLSFCIPLISLFLTSARRGRNYLPQDELARAGFRMLTYMLERSQTSGVSWRIKLRGQGCSSTRQRRVWQSWFIRGQVLYNYLSLWTGWWFCLFVHRLFWLCGRFSNRVLDLIWI
jgi:hypothetical protein